MSEHPVMPLTGSYSSCIGSPISAAMSPPPGPAPHHADAQRKGITYGASEESAQALPAASGLALQRCAARLRRGSAELGLVGGKQRGEDAVVAAASQPGPPEPRDRHGMRSVPGGAA